jgi:tetratricopeptide (TPR) repeat protein
MPDRSAFQLRALDEVGFAGRAKELALLDDALARAKRFQAPQRVTLTGAAGIGKSRLVREWCRLVREREERGADAPARIVEVRAPELATGAGAVTAGAPDPTFDVIAALLRRRLGLDGLDRGAAQMKLRDEVYRVFADRRVVEVAALLGGLLGFEVADSPFVELLARRRQRQADLSLAVLARFLERDAVDSPLVLVLDDLQRAEDASLDLLQALPAELGEGRLLLVTAARPELFVRRPSWGNEGSHLRVEVGPLARPEQEQLMRAMLSDDDLVPNLVTRAADESGGNPSLLEQLLRVYRQHGILTVEGGQGTHGPGWMIDLERATRETMAVTPDEAAANRVALLTDAERDLLGRGATFGDVFWTGAAVALGRLGVEPSDAVRVFAPDTTITEIQQLLGGLRDRGYLVGPPTSSIDSEIEWRFQNPRELELIRARVDSDLMRRRKLFAAQWLESHVAGTRGPVSASEPVRERLFVQLGGLYQDAGDRRRAAYCFLSAGAIARARPPLEQALALYLRGIALLDVDDAVAKMDALHVAGDLAARLGRTRDAVAHYQEMLRLAWWLDLPAKGGAAHDRLGRLFGLLGEHGVGLGHLTLARELFEIAGDLPGIAAALDDMGRIRFLAGAPEESLEHHRAALAAREQLGDERGRALTLARLGQVEHETGALAPAGAHFREALELRRKIGDRQGEVSSLLDMGGLERDLGRVERALELLDRGRGLAREIGDRLLECNLEIAIGGCRLTEGRAGDARAKLAPARDVARRFGAKHLVCEATRGIAEAELLQGRWVEARNEARAAFEIADKIGSPPQAGAALRVAATAVGRGAPGDPDLGGAREMFDRAVQILGDAGAELELGRTLAAYADFEERTGRHDAATALRRQTEIIVEKAHRPGRTKTGREFTFDAMP